MENRGCKKTHQTEKDIYLPTYERAQYVKAESRFKWGSKTTASKFFCVTGRVLADAAGADLISCDAELDGDIYRLIGHSDRWLDQRHEEEWEPDDADQGKDYEATHPIFDNFLLLLSWRVWKFLENCTAV